MKRKPPDISVIIPTCDRPHFIGDAIDSVLRQGAGRLEVIVVDASEAGETACVVRRFGPPVRYLRHERRGPAAARNRGMEVAAGELLAFLDDDDLWSPEALALQRSALFEQPEIGIVLGHTQRMVLRETAPGKPEFLDYRAPVRLYSLGCGLFRRKVFNRVGRLDEKMQHAEDDDWFMRARALDIPIHFLPQVTLYYRFHGTNMSIDKKAKRPDMLRLVKNRLDRMRAGEADR